MITQLLMHKGRPVPWITRWTSEVCTPGPRLIVEGTPAGIRLSFENEQPEDRIEGILYLRENNSPGVGEPMWKDIHTHRQRQCMVEGRCQVCGQIIEPPIPWLLSPTGSVITRQGSRIITDTAPTCGGCLETAKKHCPHLLRYPTKVVDVRGYRIHGLFGDVIDFSGAYGKQRHYQADRRVDDTHPLDNIVVRQTIVELWDHRKRRP